jgi:hypothetical protein
MRITFGCLASLLRLLGMSLERAAFADPCTVPTALSADR